MARKRMASILLFNSASSGSYLTKHYSRTVIDQADQNSGDAAVGRIDAIKCFMYLNERKYSRAWSSSSYTENR